MGPRGATTTLAAQISGTSRANRPLSGTATGAIGIEARQKRKDSRATADATTVVAGNAAGARRAGDRLFLRLSRVGGIAPTRIGASETIHRPRAKTAPKRTN